jgi:hypothetical protein
VAETKRWSTRTPHDGGHGRHAHLPRSHPSIDPKSATHSRGQGEHDRTNLPMIWTERRPNHGMGRSHGGDRISGTNSAPSRHERHPLRSRESIRRPKEEFRSVVEARETTNCTVDDDRCPSQPWLHPHSHFRIQRSFSAHPPTRQGSRAMGSGTMIRLAPHTARSSFFPSMFSSLGVARRRRWMHRCSVMRRPIL